MKTNKFYLIAALLGVMFTACQKEQAFDKPEETPETVNVWTLTVHVNTDRDTKAMSYDGTSISTSWAKDEKVDVYFGGKHIGTLTADAAGTSTTLQGNVTKPDGLGNNSKLMLLFPGRTDHQWTYMGQDGTAPSQDGTMATKFDYAKATLTVDSVDDVNKQISAVIADAENDNFKSQQSVYRIGFKLDDDSFIEAKSFTVCSDQNKLVRSLSGSEWTPEYGYLSLTASNPSSKVYFMSIRNDNTSANDKYTFSVIGTDDALYEGSKTIPAANLGNGKFIGLNNANPGKGLYVSKKSLEPATPGVIDDPLEVI